MKWKKIGRILVLDRYPKNPCKLLGIHNVDSVIKVNKITGKTREPNIEILAGDKTETIHKENSCFFKLDLSKIMWSKGNVNERLRISKLVKDSETIVDMFAGIGYFSIPIAVHGKPKQIFSIEINPNSYSYLNENIILNKVNNKIKPILGDCKDIAPKLSADRVIMGYIKTTHDFLEPAIKCLKKEGTLHYHETVPNKLINTRPYNRIKEVAKDREVKVTNIEVIKKYSPGVSHAVVDAKIY
jgi:tRNA wybutosine-synthesizing protein 2